MIFDESRPESQYYIQPQYATGEYKRRLALEGYKANGEQNTWGKISSWIPALGLELNALAKNTASNSGATDTVENIKEDNAARWNKLGTVVGAGVGVAGGFMGNPQMIGQGLNLAATFGGQLAFDQTSQSEEQNYIYR